MGAARGLVDQIEVALQIQCRGLITQGRGWFGNLGCSRLKPGGHMDSYHGIARSLSSMGRAGVQTKCRVMHSTPVGYLAWTSESVDNAWESFWQANCAVRYRSNSSFSAITDLRMGRVQKMRQILAGRLIHKVCSGRHANLARLLFVRVYKTSPCAPLLFPLR